ncbi:MAG: helix-turn-helix domain-containing protein [Alphaproteobacteria bacterium]|nr:helix-turn-helix domain-containing protein [Alphaproteobacteria bacterium]MDE2494976.1 helix-turn-helix domain-containing protein [Alphaproteobacteria bacterium]
MIPSETVFEEFSGLATRRSKLLVEEAELWSSFAKLLYELDLPVTTMTSAEPMPAAKSQKDHLLVSEAADFLNVKGGTLAKWRLTGEGPPFIKIGHRIMYQRNALEQFLQERTFPHTSAYRDRENVHR